MISVFQIYFDQKSEQHLDPDFYPFNKNFEDDYFENSVIKNIYDELHKPSDINHHPFYIGITSWQQQSKTNLTGKEIIDYIQKDIDSGTEKDIYIYSPIQGIEPASDFSNKQRFGIIRFPDIWAMHKSRYFQIDKDNCLLNDSRLLSFNLFDGKWQYCHCNYWIARKSVFDEYCEKVLLPAIAFYELPEIKTMMPKWYQHVHTGKYHNSCCFTMEGLFGAFLAHSNYTFDYICKKELPWSRGKYEMIRIDGYEITNS